MLERHVPFKGTTKCGANRQPNINLIFCILRYFRPECERVSGFHALIAHIEGITCNHHEIRLINAGFQCPKITTLIENKADISGNAPREPGHEFGRVVHLWHSFWIYETCDLQPPDASGN